MSSRPIAALTLLVIAMARPCAAQTEAEALSASFRKAGRAVLPAVVTIRGLGGVAAMTPEPGFLAPGVPYPGRNGVPDSGGSGVVIDAARGLILTNDHVVPDVPRVVVALADGRRRDAREVLRDPRSDLALIRIDPEGLAQAEWGDSDALDLADWVLAVGQPFGLPGTLTAGLVSGERREFGPLGYDDLIQTSAAINPGSSGGPLVDLKGRVVGINVAIKTLTGGYEGVGFAVPAARARRVASDLASLGRVRRAYLGVGTDRAESGLAAPSGVVVTSVAPGSPAQASGVQPGDVIVKVGDRRVTSPSSLRTLVEFAAVDADLPLTISRDGREQVVAVRPAIAPEDPRGLPRPGAPGR